VLATGKQVVMLQASLSQIEGQPVKLPKDPHDRARFAHPALQPADALLNSMRRTLLHKKKLAGLAEQYGLPEVLRWLPMRVRLELEHVFLHS
jgi:large subunit ribosomal protein L15